MFQHCGSSYLKVAGIQVGFAGQTGDKHNPKLFADVAGAVPITPAELFTLRYNVSPGAAAMLKSTLLKNPPEPHPISLIVPPQFVDGLYIVTFSVWFTLSFCS